MAAIVFIPGMGGRTRSGVFFFLATGSRVVVKSDIIQHCGGSMERYCVTGSFLMWAHRITDPMTIHIAVNARTIRDHCLVDCA